MARQARRSSGRSAMAVVSTTRVAPAANASWMASARIEAAGELQRDAPTREAIAPTASRLAGAPVRAPSKSTRWMSFAPCCDEPLDDPVGPVGRRPDAGRRAGPVDDARAAALEVDGRDDQHGAQAPSPASSRRWKLIGSEPLRSSVSWKPLQRERVAEPALLVGAQLEEQRATEQVRQGIGRPVGVPLDLGAGVGPLEARLLDEEVDRLVDGQLAAVQPDVEDDPAGPPDRVGVEHQPEARVVVEAVLAHHQLRVHPPALDELGGVGHQPGQRRMRRATSSWRWWPG